MPRAELGVKGRRDRPDNGGMQAPPPISVAVADGSVLPPPPQMTAEHFREIAAARVGWGRVRRAVAVARFDGWTMGVFGGLTLLLGLGSVAGVLLGAGLIGVAVVELRGAGRLGRLEAGAARVLGMNQLAAAVMLAGYAGWRIWAAMTGPGAYEAVMAAEPAMRATLEPVGELVRTITLVVYGALIGVAVVGQGSLAWFYFTRGKHVRAYVARTPGWIVGMQRAGVGL